jgi:uncharacterized protein YndB with AHSA1/START domain
MPATTTRQFFSRETRVARDIHASASRVWELLTDAPRYATWNSTIVRMSGRIAEGESIELVSTLDPSRTFKLRVRVFEPPHRLVWGDAMGRRTFELLPNARGVTFSMTERIGGPLFPLFARMIPSFDAAFDQFAADLASAAESTGGTA